MGREIRRVPPGWNHPRKENGRYQPMYDRSFSEEAKQWVADCIAWNDGTHPDCEKHKANFPFWWQWHGNPPDGEYYRPEWTNEERTHYQMYQCTSEGTPISPVFATPEEVARWCADNGASAFAGMTATYEDWLAVANGGYAPSAAVVNGGPLISGVELAGSHQCDSQTERK